VNVDRSLREAFRFEAADLGANRAGRLSPRQRAVIRGGRTGMELSLAVLAAVMLGTVGLVAFFNWRLEMPGAPASGIGAAAGVALVVILIGYGLSRRHLSAVRRPQLREAEGPVEIVSDAADNCRIRIGQTLLRLPSPSELQAFRPRAEYRLCYLVAPVAIVLSGEALATGARPDPVTDEPATGIAPLTVVKRGYAIVVLLGILALGIPVAGALASDLPAHLQPFAWIGLLILASGFVWFAVG
jgi:hypothetical protein